MSVVIVHPNGELTMDTIQHYKTYGSFQHCWKTLTHEIHLYGKKKGKAGDENKYEFPPPVDNILFFTISFFQTHHSEYRFTLLR